MTLYTFLLSLKSSLESAFNSKIFFGIIVFFFSFLIIRSFVSYLRGHDK